jgi:hypothetical protein
MRSPDATPFTLTVQATGYKPFSSEVRYGRFRVAVALQNETSSTENTISWARIDEGEFMGANCAGRGRPDVKSTTGLPRRKKPEHQTSFISTAPS